MGIGQDLRLVEAVEAFSQWRRTKVGRGRIPQNLWDIALGLLDRHGVQEICSALRLNPTQFRKVRDRCGAEADRFVEIGPLNARLSGRIQETVGSRMTFESPTGWRIVLVLAADDRSWLDAILQGLVGMAR